jgi:hypothetical protein
MRYPVVGCSNDMTDLCMSNSLWKPTLVQQGRQQLVTQGSFCEARCLRAS